MASFWSSLFRRTVLTAGALVCALSLMVTGCSDDPILGPDEGEPDDSGGSYSVIKRLAPSDTAQGSPQNPERF